MKLQMLFVGLSLVPTVNAMAQGGSSATLSASPKNMSQCMAGDGVWGKKWGITVGDQSATVSGGTPIKLKKTQAGVYEDQLRVGSASFTITLTDTQLRVVNKAYGCVWEGNRQ
jgi:hypothetical protein